MGKVKNWVYNKFFKEELEKPSNVFFDASGGSSKAGVFAGIVKRLGLRNGDATSKDFEMPEMDLSEIATCYASDSYCMQGVDKYIDMIFKEGYDFYGSNPDIVGYIKLRLHYMAEATGVPLERLLLDIAEDLVKYSNVFISKARAKDPASLPPSVSITGIDGMEPVAGYFCINPSQMQVKRDRNGTVTAWQQEVEGADKPAKFRKEDMIHIYYKRNKGDAFGMPFLLPVIGDIKALRQAEENVLKMMYRNIHPFYHVAVGDKETPGSTAEIDSVEGSINEMEVEGGLITTNRVVINAIASDKVIDASPYLKYLEERVFTGLGIPGLMFGRGSSSSRSNGDNMASEMSDRVKAMQRTIEMFLNSFMIRELLREGGYDPLMDTEHNVVFKFKENNLDSKIKTECHAVFLYEHNAITEDEMRELIGRDPVTDRSKMHQMVITQANMVASAEASPAQNGAPKVGQTKKESGANSSKETNNKNKPKNQHSPKNQDSTNSYIGLVKELISGTLEEVNDSCNSLDDSAAIEKAVKILTYEITAMADSLGILCKELQLDTKNGYIENVEEVAKSFAKDISDSSKCSDSFGTFISLAEGTLSVFETVIIDEFLKGETHEI